MKNLYVCEKCGKTFDNWDDAYHCENSHNDVDTLYSFQMSSPDYMQTQFWTDGQTFPQYIVMRGVAYDENGNCKRNLMPNGNEAAEYNAILYKRVDTKYPPVDIKKYEAAMLQKQIDDNPKEDED